MFDDYDFSTKEYDDDDAEKCPDCGSNMKSRKCTAEYWGFKSKYTEYTCKECGYVEER